MVSGWLLLLKLLVSMFIRRLNSFYKWFATSTNDLRYGVMHEVFELLWCLCVDSIIHCWSLLKLIFRANDSQLLLYDRGDCNRWRVTSGSSVLQARQLQPEPDVHASSCWLPSSNGGSYGWDSRLARQIFCLRLGNRRLLAIIQVKRLMTRTLVGDCLHSTLQLIRSEVLRITSLELMPFFGMPCRAHGLSPNACNTEFIVSFDEHSSFWDLERISTLLVRTG